MAWRETCAVDQRWQLVAEYLGGRTNLSALCREYGVSRPTAYKWIARYREGGSLEYLKDQSRRPGLSPRKTDAELEERVIALRKKHAWGGRKLQELLRRQSIELPKITIDRIIKRAGLVHEEDRRPRATKRFERSVPNDAWQVDFKGEYPLKDGRECYPLSMLDDCSRHCVGLHALDNQRTGPVWDAFVAAFRVAGLPRQILFDRGVPWYATTNGHGLTRLGVMLIKQGIELIFGRPRHPQTRGKVERFHGTLARWLRHQGIPETLLGFERSLKRFRADYNELRPHEALEMRTPASVWEPSTRCYEPQPREWEYPAGSKLRRVNSQGSIPYGKTRYFVCEALAGEWVRCQEYEGKLLVSYRHMAIREIDLRTKRTRSVIRPCDPGL